MPNEILDSDNVWDSDLLWTYNGRKLAIYCSPCRNNERVYARKQVLCFHHLHMHCAWHTWPAGKTTNFRQQRYDNTSPTEIQTTQQWAPTQDPCHWLRQQLNSKTTTTVDVMTKIEIICGTIQWLER